MILVIVYADVTDGTIPNGLDNTFFLPLHSRENLLGGWNLGSQAEGASAIYDP